MTTKPRTSQVYGGPGGSRQGPSYADSPVYGGEVDWASLAMPEAPLNAFARFSDEHFKPPSRAEAGEVHRRWNHLTAEARAKYEADAKADRERFDRECLAVMPAFASLEMYCSREGYLHEMRPHLARARLDAETMHDLRLLFTERFKALHAEPPPEPTSWAGVVAPDDEFDEDDEYDEDEFAEEDEYDDDYFDEDDEDEFGGYDEFGEEYDGVW